MILLRHRSSLFSSLLLRRPFVNELQVASWEFQDANLENENISGVWRMRVVELPVAIWSYEIVENKENENISSSSEDNIQKVRISKT